MKSSEELTEDCIEKFYIPKIKELEKTIKSLEKERDEYKKCKQHWYEKYRELLEAKS